MKLYTVGPIEGNIRNLERALRTRLASLEDTPRLVVAYIPSDVEHLVYLKCIRQILSCPFIGATAAACFTERGYSLNGSVLGIFTGDFNVDIVSTSLKGDFRTNISALFKNMAMSQNCSLLSFVDIDMTIGDYLTEIISDFVPDGKIHLGANIRDSRRLANSKLFVEDEVLTDSFICAVISGQAAPDLSVLHGFRPLEGAHVVTQVDGRRLIHLDGAPAAKSLFDTLVELKRVRVGADLRRIVSEYKIGIKRPLCRELLVRSIVGVDNDNSILLESGLNHQDTVYLLNAQEEDLLMTARIIGKEAVQKARPRAHIVFDSIERLRVLGERYHEEIESICGKDEHPVLGFVSFGELIKEYHVTQGFHQATIVSSHLVREVTMSIS